MRDTFKKGLAIGLGLAMTSKEQAEKMFDDLVKKGELTQQESKDFIREMRQKGEESQQQIDDKIQQKISHVFDDLNVASKEEVRALEQRIQQLEDQQKLSDSE
ncbi:phasin family protein [Aquibacillus sediminis]|uniref:phasin family protein n=1 Tax=Aquibacillus sediminis TaxID=2574734 RepID=UPI0011081216|nr:polyhydroxyalkanoate synthesis regulator [Aquibacillus sediminis]